MPLLLSRVSGFAGKIIHAFGLPGLIRSTACHNRLGVPVEVTVNSLFTIVRVRDVQLFFHRLTGSFDGLLVVDPLDCSDGESPERSAG